MRFRPPSKNRRASRIFTSAASAIGVESHQVDGNDPLAVYEMTQDAVAKCRAGKGPILIEAKTFRHMGHHVNDPGKYMPADKLAYYKERDPVDRARNNLTEMSGIDAAQIEAIESEIRKEFEDAVEFSRNSREITIDRIPSLHRRAIEPG
jgi:TPP-dependent pyruvate/acetoin dehydrogenase alpha subunit